MVVVGIPAEYNPLHRGHVYHINKARELTGADFVVAAISGDFTQRGELAIADKWERSRWAVRSGVDLVIEIPFLMACNRAEYFAMGAVDSLILAGVTHIAFGCEAEDPQQLIDLAEDMMANESQIDEIRYEHMTKGVSYAKATETALRQLFGDNKAEIALSPNNILAIEYLIRIRYWESKGRNIIPVPIKRKSSGYYEINEEEGYAGATEIRKLISSGENDKAALYMCQESRRWLEDNPEIKEKIEDAEEHLYDLVKYEIMRSDADELEKIMGVGEGLENLLKKQIISSEAYDNLIGSVTSRRYTSSVVRRILIYIVNGTDKCRLSEVELNWIRVLAAGDKGRELIRIIKKDESLGTEVITNINKVSKPLHMALEADVKAHDIYNVINRRNLYKYSDHIVRPYIE